MLMEANHSDPQRLLDWYDRVKRDLPWRAGSGETPDPYRVWLSEIMLQQTTVQVVAPRYTRFLSRWPTVHDLAAAPRDDVLAEWSGLGYYARARNAHACARMIMSEHDGVFPDSVTELAKLPGIGSYTAAAIAAIAWNRQAAAVDGNVERVISRVDGLRTPATKAQIRQRVEKLIPVNRPGDFAQALMELGATVCTPRRPDCAHCPWSAGCTALKCGIVAELPVRKLKAARVSMYATVFCAIRKDGSVLFRRRPETGLLAGMLDLPSTPMRTSRWLDADATRFAPVLGAWRFLDQTVRHDFTHLSLNMKIACCQVDGVDTTGLWHTPQELTNLALATMTKKALRCAGIWPRDETTDDDAV